jgi:hypothetical protein
MAAWTASAVICLAVALNVKVLGGEIDGGGVVEASGVYRTPIAAHRAGIA